MKTLEENEQRDNRTKTKGDEENKRRAINGGDIASPAGIAGDSASVEEVDAYGSGYDERTNGITQAKKCDHVGKEGGEENGAKSAGCGD